MPFIIHVFTTQHAVHGSKEHADLQHGRGEFQFSSELHFAALSLTATFLYSFDTNTFFAFVGICAVMPFFVGVTT